MTQMQLGETKQNEQSKNKQTKIQTKLLHLKKEFQKNSWTLTSVWVEDQRVAQHTLTKSKGKRGWCSQIFISDKTQVVENMQLKAKKQKVKTKKSRADNH